MGSDYADVLHAWCSDLFTMSTIRLLSEYLDDEDVLCHPLLVMLPLHRSAAQHINLYQFYDVATLWKLKLMLIIHISIRRAGLHRYFN